MLGWEALTALATAASAIVVAGTIIVGVRQIEHARNQVSQLRKATQLQGTMQIFEGLLSEEFGAALRFIMHDLKDKMNDEGYRDEAGDPWPAHPHPELDYLRRLEQYGILVRYGLVEPEPLLDLLTPSCLDAWRQLEEIGVIAEQRRRRGGLQWHNAEDLFRRAKAFYEREARDFA